MNYQVEVFDWASGQWKYLNGFNSYVKACKFVEMLRRQHPGWEIRIF